MADSRASASAPSSSNNPFRRKSASTPGAGPLTNGNIDPVFAPSSDTIDPSPQQPTTSDLFRQQLQALSQTNEPPPSTTFQKPKVVKKVRVQSPPPSSPESTGRPHDYPAYGYPNESSESSSSDDDAEEPEDPFPAVPPPLGVIGHANYSAPTAPPTQSGQAPPNPFKKTLEDIEHGSTESPAQQGGSVGGKGSLDVDAFKRLLMTGQASAPGMVHTPAVSSPGSLNHPSQAADAASITDASSVSRQSIFDTAVAQETPRTSHEISEAEVDEDRRGLIQSGHIKTQQTTSMLRKKPPPPSSRHGKLIKVDLSKKENNGGLGPNGVLRPSSSSSQTVVPGSPSSTSSKRRPTSPSDVNKPLPPAPARRSMDEASESIFDREAAGKVPEPVDSELEPDTVPTPRPPTPTKASHAATTRPPPSDLKKPPPPPRRSTHSRTESKLSPAPKPSMAPAPAFTDDTSSMRRTSQDSTHSRSSSLRVSVHAPAPPPPRRPNHASRPSFSSSSPASFAGLTPMTASAATSPGPSDSEHPPFQSPVPVVASPDPIIPSPGSTSISSTPVPPVPSTASPSTTRTKMAPPPLPPARHTSIRSSGRPASLRSVDAPSRPVKERTSSASATAPPPPPPPKRSRAGSGRDRGALMGGPVTEEPAPAASTDDAGARRSEDKSADDILADLSALQREVDALRGKYEQGPAAGV